MESKIKCLDKLIGDYSLLILNANDSDKKAYELLITSMNNQKIKIQQTINDFDHKNSRQIKNILV